MGRRKNPLMIYQVAHEQMIEYYEHLPDALRYLETPKFLSGPATEMLMRAVKDNERQPYRVTDHEGREWTIAMIEVG